MHATAKELRCPRDKALLTEAPQHQCRAHSCAQCEGVFIDQDKVSGLRSHAAWHRNARPPVGQDYLFCPHDGDRLIPFKFKEVDVDVCFTCFGAWLDKGELQKVMARIPPRRALAATAAAGAAVAYAQEEEEGWTVSKSLDATDLVLDVANFLYDAVCAALET